MKDIAIFGCGIAGKRAWHPLKSRYRIITFLDNDAHKHGLRVFGIAVSDPKTYDYNRVDHVFIASMYLDEILVQLLELGVHSSKIEYVSTDMPYMDPPKTVAGTFCRSSTLSWLRRVFYIPFRLLRRTGRKQQCPV